MADNSRSVAPESGEGSDLSLQTVNHEILCEILEFLDPLSLYNLARTCRDLHDRVVSEVRNRLRHFPRHSPFTWQNVHFDYFGYVLAELQLPQVLVYAVKRQDVNALANMSFDMVGITFHNQDDMNDNRVIQETIYEVIFEKLAEIAFVSDASHSFQMLLSFMREIDPKYTCDMRMFYHAIHHRAISCIMFLYGEEVHSMELTETAVNRAYDTLRRGDAETLRFLFDIGWQYSCSTISDSDSDGDGDEAVNGCMELVCKAAIVGDLRKTKIAFGWFVKRDYLLCHDTDWLISDPIACKKWVLGVAEKYLTPFGYGYIQRLLDEHIPDEPAVDVEEFNVQDHTWPSLGDNG